MSEKVSRLNKITWIVTELIIGIAATGYGLYGIFTNLDDPQILHIIIAAIGGVFLLIAIAQMGLGRRKKKVEKKIEHCPKCGTKVQKGDEHCRKCGKKLE